MKQEFIKTLSNEDRERLYKELEIFNQGRECDAYYYKISVGEKAEMFTLWRHRVNGGWGEKYLCNLSTDFETALHKAMNKIANSSVRLEVDTDTNIDMDANKATFQFGKYRGQLIADVATTDIRYLFWVRDNRKTIEEDYLLRRANGDFIKGNFENIDAQIEFYFDTMTKTNQETCKSNYFGVVGQRINTTFKLKVISSRIKESQYGKYIQVVLVDGKENEYQISLPNTHKYFFTPLEKGSIVTFTTATIKEHKEIMGRKRTFLSYFNLL